MRARKSTRRWLRHVPTLGGSLALVALLACASFRGDEQPDGSDASGSGSSGSSGSTPSDAGGELRDVATSGPTEAGGDDGGDRPPPPSACIPVSTFLPPSGASTAGTSVCNVDRLAREAGAAGPAGLDYKPGDPIGKLDGIPVTSCVGVRFAEGLTSSVVRASATGTACSYACKPGIGCGSCREALVFTGDGTTYKVRTRLVGLAETASDFSIPMPSGGAPTEVVVCRTDCGEARDDIQVWSIYGTCSR